MDTWIWIERASWLVAIVGIPSLVIGLLALTRRPRLSVGFLPFRKAGIFGRRDEPRAETKASPTFTKTPELSDTFQVDMVILNLGSGSARDLLVNFKFPPKLGREHLIVALGPAHHLDRMPTDDGLTWSFHHSYLHPGDRIFCEFGVQVPASLDRIEIAYEISMADSPTVRGSANVVVSRPT